MADQGDLTTIQKIEKQEIHENLRKFVEIRKFDEIQKDQENRGNQENLES
jgi:hypothetical protein